MTHNDLAPIVFDLIAEEGWQPLTLNAIAVRAKISLADLHAIATSKEDVMGLLIAFIEEKSFVPDQDLVGLSPEEKSFEVLMRRFEEAQPYRAGISRLCQNLKESPCQLQPLMPQLVGALERLSHQAGLNFEGVMGPVQVRFFGLIYGHLFQEWLLDETPDLSKTMAKTDRSIKIYIPCLFDPIKILEVF